MAFSEIFNAEVVGDETEENGYPFLVPEAGSGGALVVEGYVEKFFDKLVCNCY